MMDFTVRSHQKELMDDPGIPREDLEETYRQLSHVNQWQFSNWLVKRHLRDFFALNPRRELHITDIGCGDGATLRYIRRLAAAAGRPVRLTGVDISEAAVTAARRISGSDGIDFRKGSVLDLEWRTPPDICLSTLTFHHLEHGQIIGLLKWMNARSALGWIVVDLHRSAAAYYLFKFLSKGMGYNRYIQHDGPLSVTRAFRAREWRAFLEEAGIPAGQARVSWYPNFRYVIRCRKNL